MARRPAPLREAIVDAFVENKPLARAVVEGMRNAGDDPRSSMEPTQIDQRAVQHVTEAVAPIVANAGNKEPNNASRVISGSTVAAVSGFMVALGPMIEGALQALNRPEWLAVYYFLFGGTAAGGGLFALFGRLRKGLPPMTFKPWNPFTWFAPRPAA